MNGRVIVRNRYRVYNTTNVTTCEGNKWNLAENYCRVKFSGIALIGYMMLMKNEVHISIVLSDSKAQRIDQQRKCR